MSRFQFEEWLLDDSELNAGQRLALEDELERDPELSELRDRLHALDIVMRAAAMAEPRPGFVGRWRSLVTQGREKKVRGQMLMLLGALSAVGAMALSLAGALIFSSPAELASSALKAVVELRLQFDFIWGFLAAFMEVIPFAMGALMLAGFLAALAWLSVVWITSLYRFVYLEQRNGV